MHSRPGLGARAPKGSLPALTNLPRPPTAALAAFPPCRRRDRLATAASSSSSSSASTTSYRCTKCGARPSQPMGRCPVCREWGTVVEHVQTISPSSGGGGDGLAAARRAVAAAANAKARSTSSSSAPDALANSTFFEFDSQGEPVFSSPRPSAGWLVQQDDVENDDAVPETLEQISRRRRREAASSSSSSSSFATRLPLPTKTGAEIARVLGGGLVPGSVVLIGGDPGVGKSTLLLQAASLVARACCADGGAASAPSSPPAPADQVGRPVLYVSAEESKEQLWMRAVRLGLVPGEGDENDDNDAAPATPSGDLRLVSENRLEAVLSSIASLRPSLVIVDSVQTVLLSGLDHRPGSVAQVRECATALLHAAKRLRTAVLLVGHVTKGGELAGPKTLEHLVDAVIYLEGGGGGAGGGGGTGGQYRLLRAQKNRHGSVGEVAILRHGPKGLEAVDDYRSLFVSSAAFDGADDEEEEEEEEGGLPSASSSSSSAAAAVGAGSALTVVQEGRRALVIEVQALVAGREGGGGGGSGYARRDDYSNNSDDEEDEDDEEAPQRQQRWRGNSGFGPSSSSSSAPLYRAAVGFASRERLPLLLEVLAKHGACQPARACRRSHVFASVAGGYRTRPGETATDLALCAALVSSALGTRLPRRTAVLGEVGLAGELRPVPELEARLREAAAMGFQRVVVPSANDAPVVVAEASSPSSPGGRRRRGGSGGGAGGSGKAPALALDGLRKELGGGGGDAIEIVSVPTLRAALRYLFGERLRAAAGKRQQQRRRRARRASAEEEEEEAALVTAALAAAGAANRAPLL